MLFHRWHRSTLNAALQMLIVHLQQCSSFCATEAKLSLQVTLRYVICIIQYATNHTTDNKLKHSTKTCTSSFFYFIGKICPPFKCQFFRWTWISQLFQRFSSHICSQKSLWRQLKQTKFLRLYVTRNYHYKLQVCMSLLLSKLQCQNSGGNNYKIKGNICLRCI